MSGYSLYSPNTGPTHDYKKIFCAYHRTQFLTNFCIEKDCLMPLCPSCVAQHTQYHNKSTQKATYINLQEALQEARQKCYTMIVNLQQNQRKNQQILGHIEELPQNLHQQLNAVKQQIFEQIEQLFEQYYHQILKQIAKKYQQSKVYNQIQTQEMKNLISNTIDQLYDKIGIQLENLGMLKSEQCLAGLITYYGEDQQFYQNTMEEIEQFLSRHKKTGKINIMLNGNNISSQLEGLCQKCLILTMAADSNFAYEPLNENSLSKKNISTTSRMNKNNIKITQLPINSKNLSMNKLGSRVNRSINQ